MQKDVVKLKSPKLDSKRASYISCLETDRLKPTLPTSDDVNASALSVDQQTLRREALQNQRTLIIGLVKQWGFHSQSLKESKSLPVWDLSFYKDFNKGNVDPQGVLLLNAVLTVRKHHANSHAKKGWEQFTDGIIKDNLTEDGRVVFLLWGNNAREKSRNHRVFRDQMWSEEFLARLKKLEEAWKAAKNVGDKFPANTVYNKSKEPMKWIPAGEY
ncbi:Uracil-DNA glycosylase, mitochondrial [Glycine soja]